MKTSVICIVSSLLLFAAPAFAHDPSHQEPLVFHDGTNHAVVEGEVEDDHIADYQLAASEGQTLTVALQPEDASANFNVMAPDGRTVMFIGAVHGKRYASELPADGIYTIRVYLTQTAARRVASADYRLHVELGDARPQATATGSTSTAAATSDDLTLQRPHAH